MDFLYSSTEQKGKGRLSGAFALSEIGLWAGIFPPPSVYPPKAETIIPGRPHTNRNWMVSIIEILDDLLKEKLIRLRNIMSKTPAIPTDYFSETENHAQILLIIQSIHEFFAERLTKGRKLRLGIWN